MEKVLHVFISKKHKQQKGNINRKNHARKRSIKKKKTERAAETVKRTNYKAIDCRSPYRPFLNLSCFCLESPNIPKSTTAKSNVTKRTKQNQRERKQRDPQPVYNPELTRVKISI